jgi:hypothetical protein
MTIVGEILWPVALCWAVSRMAEAAERFAPQVDEARQDEDVEIPEDLVALAMTHSEGWAQEDTIKAIRERYEQLRDWNRVRSAFGIGHIAD